MKYNLACGNDKNEGPDWTNVDIGTVCKPDIVADLLTEEGWAKLPVEIADEVRIRHFVEHIPHRLPHTNKDGLIWFMEKLYALCRDGCKVHISFPHPGSLVAYGDPTHCRTLTGMTIKYFDAQWREQNDFANYGIETDFEVESAALGLMDPYTADTPDLGKTLDSHWNVAWQIIMDLRACKPKRSNS